jgi:hypothetical protein
MADEFKTGDGARVIARGTKQFDRAVKSIGKDFVKDVVKELEKMDTKSGQVLSDNQKNRDFVSQTRGRIRKVLEKLGYFGFINDFTFNFNTLSRYLVWVQKRVNEISIKSAFITPFRQNAIKEVLNSLQGQGLDANLIRPIQQQMDKAVKTGGNWLDMSTNVENFLNEGKNGKLARLAEIGSMDALGQFNGLVNDRIRTEFGLEMVRYIGNIIEDTRPQCMKWVAMREWPIEQLPAEIAWAEKNGSGWIKGTTVGTFFQNRGGYRCRHEAIPTRKKE